MSELFRRLPRMNEILDDPGVRAWASDRGVDRDLVRRAATRLLDELRVGIGAEALDAEALESRLGDLPRAVAGHVDALLRPHLRRVVNATGIVVHTNLGRSPWPAAAALRVAELASTYLNLEMDLESGQRGGRDRPLQRLVDELFPGFAAVAVNNCAAAVLLVLNTLAEGKEVIVSRGQLVEIGGSFRIPDVMAKGLCRLREVGTTNRTRIEDFRDAAGPDTAMFLAVHPSNYRMVGFTQEVALEELVELGRETGVLVVEDLGSGSLMDLSSLGIDEPTVADRLATGVDLLTFSGDKLLGGPQAGLIVGKPDAVARVRANPLYRALRLDKVMLLALEASLTEVLAGRTHEIPTLAMLLRSGEQLRAAADVLAERLRPAVQAAGGSLEVLEVDTRVGGGAAPEVALPAWAVALVTPMAPDELARRLRGGDPAVVGRIMDDRILLDVRTLLPGDEQRLEMALAAALRPPRAAR